MLLLLATAAMASALGAASAPAQGQSAQDEAVAARLDDYLTRSAAFGFAGGVLVARQGHALLCKGYGLADRANGVPWSADTAFDIGSVTKQFTAAAILKLEMLGKLEAAEPISEFFPAAPHDKAGITLHQLLTHTSGLARDGGGHDEILARDEVVARILATPLATRPGQGYSYSNVGYTLLAAVVEKASGETYHAFLREHLFDPLGMARTGFYGEASRWPKDTVAHSYYETAEEGCPIDWPATWTSTGNGHVITTLPDLLRWENGLRGMEILSEDAKREMWKPQVPIDAEFAYGYGWRVSRGSAKPLYFHTGYYRSFGTEYRRYAGDDLAIVVVTNEGHLGGTGQQVAITDPVASIALGRKQELPPPVVALDAELARRILGEYRLPSGARLTFGLRNGSLIAEAAGQDAFDALFALDEKHRPERENTNREARAMIEATLQGDPARLTPDLDEEGAATYAPMIDPGWSALAKKCGAFVDFEVLGTAPCPFDDDCTRAYARLRFEREDVIVSFGFRGGVFFDLGVWDGAPDPAAVFVAPLSPTRFATWDLWRASGACLEFRAEGAAITSVTLALGGQAVTATRVE